MKELLKDIVSEKSLEYIVQNYPSLRHLSNISEKELMLIPGIGRIKSREIKAIFEISKRLLMPDGTKDYYIATPNDAFEYLKTIAFYQQEVVYAVYLNTKNRVIDSRKLFVGTLNSCVLHPREVYGPACSLRAASVLVAHNHPSSDISPSPEDISVAKRLYEAGKITGIEFVDSLIISERGFCSLKEKGVII